MSDTEQGMTFCAGEGGLSPDALERLARIRVLARQNARQYAGEKFAAANAMRKAKPAAKKAAKPYFYNPAQRD